MNPLRRMFFVWVLVLAPLPALAQYYNSLSGRQFGNMYAANADRLMSQMVQQSGYAAMRASIEAAAKKQGGPGAAQATPTVPSKAAKVVWKHPIAATDFTPTGPRRVPEQLAEGAADPKDRGDLVMAGREIQKAIEASPGFRRNNLAAAMTVLVGVSIQVLKGIELSDAESQELMRGFNDELAALDAFRSMPAAQRTQMYDTLVVIGGFIAGIAHAGAETNDRSLQEQARAMARDALAKFGAKA